MEESVPTISDFTEHTTEGQMNQEEMDKPMEEDEDGLATIMSKGIPKTITIFSPNHGERCKE
jgi:hypothetical protein